MKYKSFAYPKCKCVSVVCTQQMHLIVYICHDDLSKFTTACFPNITCTVKCVTLLHITITTNTTCFLTLSHCRIIVFESLTGVSLMFFSPSNVVSFDLATQVDHWFLFLRLKSHTFTLKKWSDLKKFQPVVVLSNQSMSFKGKEAGAAREDSYNKSKK